MDWIGQGIAELMVGSFIVVGLVVLVVGICIGLGIAAIF